MTTLIIQQTLNELDTKGQSNSSPNALMVDSNTDIIAYIRSLSNIIRELQDSETV